MILNPGDKIEVLTKGKRKFHRKQCTVVSYHPKFLTVDYGNYKGTINLSDIKFGHIKIKVLEVADMPDRLNISTEQLIEECKEHGTNGEAAKIIAAKYGLNQKQVANLIMNRGIKAKLVKECTEHGTDCKVTEHKGYQEHSLGFPTREEFISQEAVFKKTISGEWKAAESFDVEKLNKYKPRFKPKTLISQSQNGFEYSLFDEHIVINTGDYELRIDWNDLEDYIKDLQEIKRIAEE